MNIQFPVKDCDDGFIVLPLLAHDKSEVIASLGGLSHHMDEGELGVWRRLYDPRTREWYIGRWSVSVGHVVLFVGVVCGAYVFVRVNVFPFLEGTGKLRIALFCLLGLISFTHFVMLFEGPGYLAFEKELGMGQFDTAYLDDERRYVIQYVCVDCLSNTCIGKRNAKLYFLRNVYIGVLMLYMAYLIGRSIKGVFEVYIIGATTIVCGVMFFVCLSFVIILFISSVSFFDMVWTSSEVRGVIGDHGKVNNLRNVFGNVWLWWLPVPAFGNVTDRQLYEDMIGYRL